NQIVGVLADAAGAPEPRIVHVPSDAIHAVDERWGESLLGDKAHSMIFDNAKLRSLVPGYRATIPFELGAREMLAWYDADPARRVVDPVWEARLDSLVERFRA
ncbi:MAG: NAD-dependent dehydratase, partial [Salana multivorans]|nr:NAD-dependent dehydratase [Salana multivorans]